MHKLYTRAIKGITDAIFSTQNILEIIRQGQSRKVFIIIQIWKGLISPVLPKYYKQKANNM